MLVYRPPGPLCGPLLDTNTTAPVVPWATEGSLSLKLVADETWQEPSPQGSPSPCPIASHQQSPVSAHRSNQLQKTWVSGRQTRKLTGSGVQILLFQFWPNSPEQSLRHSAAKLVWWVISRLRLVLSPDICSHVAEGRWTGRIRNSLCGAQWEETTRGQLQLHAEETFLIFLQQLSLFPSIEWALRRMSSLSVEVFRPKEDS